MNIPKLPPISVRLTSEEASTAIKDMPRVEYLLRRLLAYRIAGSKGYYDDGELQDCSAFPAIDYLRDHPRDIEIKLIKRATEQTSSTPLTLVSNLADTQVLVEATKAMALALDKLVSVCLDPDGIVKAPTQGDIMKAKAMLPSYCSNSFKKSS